MIEAVNSVVSNAQVLRGSADQVDVARAAVAELQAAESISVPQAPYISPYVVVDRYYNKAVLQIRDSDTGDVLTQYPSETRLQQQQRVSQLLGGTEQPSEPSQRDVGVSAPQSSEIKVQDVHQAGEGSAAIGVSDIGQAQQASAALAAGAQAGVSNLSAGVNVQA